MPTYTGNAPTNTRVASRSLSATGAKGTRVTARSATSSGPTATYLTRRINGLRRTVTPPTDGQIWPRGNKTS